MGRKKRAPTASNWLTDLFKSHGLVTSACVIVILMITAAATLRLILSAGDSTEFNINSDLNILEYFTWKVEFNGKPKGL